MSAPPATSGRRKDWATAAMLQFMIASWRPIWKEPMRAPPAATQNVRESMARVFGVAALLLLICTWLTYRRMAGTSGRVMTRARAVHSQRLDSTCMRALYGDFASDRRSQQTLLRSTRACRLRNRL